MPQLPGSYDRARRALEYLLARRAELRQKGLPVNPQNLLDETGMHFNLSPLDTEFLAKLFAEHHRPDSEKN